MTRAHRGRNPGHGGSHLLIPQVSATRAAGESCCQLRLTRSAWRRVKAAQAEALANTFGTLADEFLARKKRGACWRAPIAALAQGEEPQASGDSAGVG